MLTEVTSIKDIPGLQSMGHTCANLNGELLFIWGGTLGDSDNEGQNGERDERIIRNRNSDLWIYETFTGYWRHRKCSGECPPHLSSCSSCLIGQKMFIFGGHSAALDDWLNCLYCLNLETFEWTNLDRLISVCEPTKPIRSDKNVCWSFEGKLYVFGGYGWSRTENYMDILDRQNDFQLTPDFRWPQFGWNNQLVEFDPNTNRWRWPIYSGKCPSARAAHAGCLMSDGKYYLFGGRDSQERLNDLYTFDMSTFTWTQLAVLETANSIRRPLNHLLENEPDDQPESIVDDEEVAAEIRAREDAEHVQIVEEIRGDSDLNYPMPSSSNSRSIYEWTPTMDEGDDLQQSDDEVEDMGQEWHHNHANTLETLSLHSRKSSSISGCSIDIGESFNRNDHDNNSTTASIQHTDHPHEGPSSSGHTLGEARNVEAQARNDDLDNQSFISIQEDNHLDDRTEPVEQHIQRTNKPVGRSFCSFTPMSDELIMLYGGVSSEDQNLNDCWLFNVKLNSWTHIHLNPKHCKPRLWHTGSKTKQGDIIIIGGSSSEKIDKFCTDVLSISLQPKSLKRLSLDTVARTIRLKTIQGDPHLLSNICKLIKLRKQAIAVTSLRGLQPAQVNRHR